jgi:hypothetical protein
MGAEASFGVRIAKLSLANPRFAAFKAVRSGRVYINHRNYPHGPNPWWDQPLIKPHEELADLIAIGRATVAGAGLHAEWTRRAVERLGYQVAQEGPADLHVTVAEGHTAPAWELAAAGQATRYTTLDALADAIRELRPTPGSRA